MYFVVKKSGRAGIPLLEEVSGGNFSTLWEARKGTWIPFRTPPCPLAFLSWVSLFSIKFAEMPMLGN